MRVFAGLVGLGLLLAAVLLSVTLIGDLRALQQTRTDLAELRDVRYGLLNAEVWVDQLADVLARRIDGFEVTDANRPTLKRNVQVVLDRLLLEIEASLRRRNSAGDDWLERMQGTLRQGVQDFLVDFDDLRARVPQYADALLDELNRPATREEIKTQLLAAIETTATATLSRTDTEALEQVLANRNCAGVAGCIARLEAAARNLEHSARSGALQVALAVTCLFALVVLPRRAALPPEAMGLLTAATLVLLVVGVWTPMIEVEARIAELRFDLLGEDIVFSDQVLYFQSKSILDVVAVLLATRAADMILVAVLITLFSLVFPTAKMVCGFLYYFDLRRLRRNPLVGFFALRSGKWSMADVLVVAMLMAYIGFSGLVTSQLSSIARSGRDVDVITTNGTSLEIGFFMFLGFVLASLVLSTRLEAHAHPAAEPHAGADTGPHTSPHAGPHTKRETGTTGR
ncbi:paraquat-inducible protein A [Thiohalocapsa marina]|uniref:Paraquat-inducible protein A n=1 Tax=Thiohalocapsa marina TaxID=424902 RepID=A0A5M8FNF1_9GAMM|nr:paraquat-inducible protein A [Thiohalocapsa marina]KAA6186279.1 paraquat-inducible protein A [Thiohalocapsa marina]